MMLKPRMTRAEFLSYAYAVLSDEALEPLYDQIAEHNSEVAAFGDSGPGALYRISASIREVNAIERQRARLEGVEPRRFYFHVAAPR